MEHSASFFVDKVESGNQPPGIIRKWLVIFWDVKS